MIYFSNFSTLSPKNTNISLNNDTARSQFDRRSSVDKALSGAFKEQAQESAEWTQRAADAGALGSLRLSQITPVLVSAVEQWTKKRQIFNQDQLSLKRHYQHSV